MKGIIGKKLGMMSYFDANGKSVGCTVIEAGPCVVTQIKTNDTDGYSAMQIAFEEKKEKNIIIKTGKPKEKKMINGEKIN